MSSPYEMTVDLNVLDHLGINLYSNMAAVLTEAVANAWDADATKVEIRVDKGRKTIEIQDDGIGMTVADMNEKYLRVGYRRRDDGGKFGSITAKGRSVMGRKGLGKLSLFSVANTIEVQSAKEGYAHGLMMTVEGIRKSVTKNQSSYIPDQLPQNNVKISTGTLIRLTEIKRQRLGNSIAALRKRLSRRFSVVGQAHGFEVLIDGIRLSPDDRGDLSVSQFIWHFGEEKPDLTAVKDLKECEQLPDQLEGWGDGWRVRGWIGTARLPKQLDDDDAGNLNSIVVFARGRLFHENILGKINDGRLYTKYLTGQIEADFLDTDKEPDIATSDRQRVQEDDPRYVGMMDFLRQQMTQIEKRWTEWRKKHEVEKAKKDNPALAKWLAGLPKGYRKSAETLIAKISALPIDKEEDQKLMYKYGIFAFERMKLRGSAEEFAQGFDSTDALMKLLADRDSLEASLYRDIVSSRLDAIRDFGKIVDDDDKEKVLQKYLFDHLWLLDPAWERATGSERIEQALKTEFKVFAPNLTDTESKGRLDIRYKTNAGTHIIVELKRAGRKMSLPELVEQGQKYRAGLSKCLEKAGFENPDIRVVFILGRPVAESEEVHLGGTTYVQETLRPLNARIVYYDEMINNAQQAYAEYLDRSKVVDRLEAIVEQL